MATLKTCEEIYFCTTCSVIIVIYNILYDYIPTNKMYKGTIKWITEVTLTNIYIYIIHCQKKRWGGRIAATKENGRGGDEWKGAKNPWTKCSEGWAIQAKAVIHYMSELPSSVKASRLSWLGQGKLLERKPVPTMILCPPLVFPQ